MVTECKGMDRDVEQLCPKHKQLYKMPSSDVNQQTSLSLACSDKQAYCFSYNWTKALACLHGGFTLKPDALMWMFQSNCFHVKSYKWTPSFEFIMN